MINFDSDEFREKSQNFTYLILVNGALIEDRINATLALCMSEGNSEKKAFRYWVGENLMFGKKKELLKIFLETNHKSILKDYPQLFLDLDKVQECRNNLAHSTRALQMKNDGTNKKLILYPVNKLSKETKKTGITKGNEIDEKEMEKIAKLSVICLTELFSINQLIIKKRTKSNYYQQN